MDGLGGLRRALDRRGQLNEGHIFIKITNDSNEGKNLSLKAGDCFAQGIFTPFGITEDDEAHGVRDGGFGSTSVSADVDRSWGALYYATALSGVSYPFTITAIDYAAASVANIYCWAMGDLGASLSDTGSVYVLSAAARTGMTLPLRLLIRGRWN